jgi:putative tryptophan/tyrosine transport system substrate-binding protein
MKRREFITLLGGAAACPFAARAREPGRVYRLGALLPAGRESSVAIAFFDEMRLLGFIENDNLTVLPNGFGVRDDELVERAEALIRAAPDIIISGSDSYTRVLQRLTRTIPLVALTEDMPEAGLSPDLDGKRQDILIEAVPAARKIAALADSTVTPRRHLEALQDAAQRRGVALSIFGVANREEVVPAIEAARAAGAQALNLLATPLFTVNTRGIMEEVAALRLPAMHQGPEVAEDGGLLGYGPRLAHALRQSAHLVARMLGGAQPADIPVEEPTHFELVINLKTARAIGHDVPAGLVLRADQVIE